MWNELLEKIREEIFFLQLVDKSVLDSYDQLAFTENITTEVDPSTTFSEDIAIPQEVSLV